MGASSEFEPIQVISYLCELRRLKVRLCLCWIPSHVGITLHDSVDEMAKAAACVARDMDLRSALAPLTLSSVISVLRALVVEAWQQEWLISERGRGLFAIFAGVIRDNRKSQWSGPRWLASLRCQLRHDHSALQGSLFRHRPDLCVSSCCVYCGSSEDESREHFLDDCHGFRDTRKCFLDSVRGVGLVSLVDALGSTDEAVIDAFNIFLQASGRFLSACYAPDTI